MCLHREQAVYLWMCDAVFRAAKKRKETNWIFSMEQRDIFLAGIVFISYLMISFSISFPVAFLHISHLKPASKRPLFRSGYSECVLDGVLIVTCSSHVLLVIVFHSVCKFCWILSDVFEMRMLSTTWCGCLWLDSMEEPVALFLSRKF